MDLKKVEYVLFDLDGTLTESSEGIINGIRYSMEKMGLAHMCEDEEMLKSFIGPALRWSYLDKFKLSEEDTDLAIEHFRSYYEKRGSLIENRLYDGIMELLETLKLNNKKIVLATSKPEETSLEVIKHFDIYKYFYFIGAAKPEINITEKDQVIAYILENCPEITADNAIMVGDRVYDVAGSGANGISCIAVSYGYAAEGELEEAKPWMIVSSVGELQRLLLS